MTIDEFLSKLGVKVKRMPLEQLRRESGKPGTYGFYRADDDTLRLPNDVGGKKILEVVAHEVIHWTGRNRRAGDRPVMGYGVPAPMLEPMRAFEEIVAEQGAEVLVRDVFHEDIHDIAEEYIRGWGDGSGMPEVIQEAARKFGVAAARWIKQKLKSPGHSE